MTPSADMRSPSSPRRARSRREGTRPPDLAPATMHRRRRPTTLQTVPRLCTHRRRARGRAPRVARPPQASQHPLLHHPHPTTQNTLHRPRPARPAGARRRCAGRIRPQARATASTCASAAPYPCPSRCLCLRTATRRTARPTDGTSWDVARSTRRVRMRVHPRRRDRRSIFRSTRGVAMILYVRERRPRATPARQRHLAPARRHAPPRSRNSTQTATRCS